MRRIRLAEVLERRFTPEHALLLFLTDRCPVGCAHCSVDSRRNSPTITDFGLFEELVAAICADDTYELVGISGGEPFVERRGLSLATRMLAEADRDIVLYTSGVWGSAEKAPAWVWTVIGRASCVFLSTDAYHAAAIDRERYLRAARVIAAAGVPIIVQVLEIDEMMSEADALLRSAFGGDYHSFAELSPITPLPYGRGRRLFDQRPLIHAAAFGACRLLAAPVVRYDGVVTACCNEQVIMGMGPDRLRRRCSSGEELTATLKALRADSLLKVLGRVSASSVTLHPRFDDLRSRSFRGICDFCWAVQEHAAPSPLGDTSDALLTAMTLVQPEVTRK